MSGEFGRYWFDTTNTFFGVAAFPAGVAAARITTPGTSVSASPTRRSRIDLRYYDTDLIKADCNVLTGDHTATFATANITATNPGGLGSGWCSEAFVAKLSFDTHPAALK